MRLATLVILALIALPALPSSGLDCPDAGLPDLGLLGRTDGAAVVFRVHVGSAIPGAGSHVVLLQAGITQQIKGQSVFYTEDGDMAECHSRIVLLLEVAPDDRPSYLRTLPGTDQLVFLPATPRYYLNYARVDPSYLLTISPATDAGLNSILRFLDPPTVDPHCR